MAANRHRSPGRSFQYEQTPQKRQRLLVALRGIILCSGGGWYRYIPPFKEGPKNRVYTWASEALNAYIRFSRLRGTAGGRLQPYRSEKFERLPTLFLMLAFSLISYRLDFLQIQRNPLQTIQKEIPGCCAHFCTQHPGIPFRPTLSDRQMLKSVFIVFDLKLSYEHRPNAASFIAVLHTRHENA